MKSLRDYQQKIAFDCAGKVGQYGLCYLSMQVRTGKTATALAAAELLGAENVLFLTKKKAISSIEEDYKDFGFKFNLVVINNESMHKVKGKFDILISDEHHRNAAFPKPNNGTKYIKQRWSKLPMIFLSGTPFPESYSQVYHQYWVSDRSPFNNYTNFYKWSKDFVKVTQQRRAGGMLANDYSNADWNKIKPLIDHTIITFTQEQSGFKSKVIEHFIDVEMKPITHKLMGWLKKDGIVVGTNDVLLADTDLKIMQKHHQLASGTVKMESGRGEIIDDSKAKAILKHFKGKKIGIFYKFVAEWKVLKQVYGDSLTNDINEFNSTDKCIALQIVSGREGISLRNADVLVYFNIDFSAVSYWQSRDRLTTMDRLENHVYWIFGDTGMEKKIYKAVADKKDYTLSLFRAEANIPKKYKQVKLL